MESEGRATLDLRLSLYIMLACIVCRFYKEMQVRKDGKVKHFLLYIDQ